jgi:hypothetical protein
VKTNANKKVYQLLLERRCAGGRIKSYTQVQWVGDWGATMFKRILLPTKKNISLLVGRHRMDRDVKYVCERI